MVVPRAELVQARGRVVVATGVLPGVRDRLVVGQAQTIGVVVVAVLDVTTAIHHFEHGAEVVGQVVVGAARGPFIHELPLIGSSVIRGGRASRSVSEVSG